MGTIGEHFHADRFELVQIFYNVQRDMMVKAIFLHVFGVGTEDILLQPGETRGSYAFTRDEEIHCRAKFLNA